MLITPGILVRPRVNHINRTLSDIIVCVGKCTGGNWWNCIVVKGSETYPVGGYDLSIHADDIRNGIRCEAVELKGGE
jgi:hypothetical protein